MPRKKRLNPVEKLAVRILLLGEEERRPRQPGRYISRLLDVSEAGVSKIKSRMDWQTLQDPPELGNLTLRELGLPEDEREVFGRFARAAHAEIDLRERAHVAVTGRALSHAD